MKTIYLNQKIAVTLDNGVAVELSAGPNTVSDEVAAHWYVRAHMKAPPEDDPRVAGLESRIAELSDEHERMARRITSLEQQLAAANGLVEKYEQTSADFSAQLSEALTRAEKAEDALAKAQLQSQTQDSAVSQADNSKAKK